MIKKDKSGILITITINVNEEMIASEAIIKILNKTFQNRSCIRINSSYERNEVNY
jgi:N-acetyl-gamma-glutamylphosphate reductase